MNEKEVSDMIDDQNKTIKTFGAKLRRAMTMISSVVIICYLLVVWPLMYMGVNYIEMHVVGFLAMIMILPILTFFAGVWIVWNKKFVIPDDQPKK